MKNKIHTLAFIAVAGVMLMGAGCPDRHWVEQQELAKISQTMKEACSDVVDIPSRGLSREDIMKLWAVDRNSLYVCGTRHKYLAKAINVLEKYYR